MKIWKSKKLWADVQSIKVWLIPLTTMLLLKHFITPNNWVTVIVSLIGMREASSAWEKNLGQDVDKMESYLNG